MAESNNFLLNKAIGERIRKIRKLQGMSLASISSSVGVSAQQFQKYETGRNKISINKLLEISQLLDVSLNNLIGIDKINKEFEMINDKNLRKLIRNYNALKSSKLKQLLVFNSRVLVEELN